MYLLRLLLCLHSVVVSLYTNYLHKVLLIRFTGLCVWVSEWDDASLCGCVCEFVLTDSTKKLNK